MGDLISDWLNVCVGLLPACACAVRMGTVCVCASPRLWITSMYALHVCVFYTRPVAPRCVSFIVRASMLAPVVRLHDSRYRYGVLLCADAWPVRERVGAGPPGGFDAQPASTGDVDLWSNLVSVFSFLLWSVRDFISSLFGFSCFLLTPRTGPVVNSVEKCPSG